MAIKAKASSQGAERNFKNYVGVASFRVHGVNPTKEELEKFLGRSVSKEQEYIKNKVDENDGNKPYKQLRVTFMIEADKKYEDGKEIDTNKALEEPLRTVVTFFLDSRYWYNGDKTKVQVIDKYARTAWVTIEQAKNHQIPVYKNGPAKIDADYRPAFRGEEKLNQFILNYLNVTPIETYNKNTGQWIPNPHPEDCEGRLDKVKDYFGGDWSELKEYCKCMPGNHVKLLVGVQTNNDGNEYMVVYNNLSLRNGAKSYSYLKDDIDNNQSSAVKDTVFSNDPVGVLKNIEVYGTDTKETDLSKAPKVDDPFANGGEKPVGADDLPFGEATDEDPFKDVA